MVQGLGGLLLRGQSAEANIFFCNCKLAAGSRSRTLPALAWEGVGNGAVLLALRVRICHLTCRLQPRWPHTTTAVAASRTSLSV